jgi:hypothetical protein
VGPFGAPLLLSPFNPETADVSPGESILASWIFQIPNFVLAALMYTLLGRVLLGFFVAADSSNYIWRFFCRLTDPVVYVLSYVTPRAANPIVLWLFGVVWLFWLRIGLMYALLAFSPERVG